jgi:hypothetical protein
MSSRVDDFMIDYSRYLYIFVFAILIGGFAIPIIWGFFDHSIWLSTVLLWSCCLGGIIGLLGLLRSD